LHPDAVIGSATDLERLINERRALLAVVGLGYVGLPAACLFAAAGFRVLGVERDKTRHDAIADGQVPLEGVEPGLAELLTKVRGADALRVVSSAASISAADIFLICVETPVEDDHRPRYEALRVACRDIGAVLKSGSLVIVESTLAPGTMDRVVRPELEASSGRVAGRDFRIGHCPERVMPGKLVRNMRTMSRVCGGDSVETARFMKALYGTVVDAPLDATDLVTAELVKTVENAYRDVNIAFANEIALICEAVGADVAAVRELVNKSPGRNMLVPGAGVGGHCIPKDPWLLWAGAEDRAAVRLIPMAREVNDSMPLHVAGLVALGLAEHGRQLRGSRIAVLGYAYLENTGDVRNSPSRALVQHLRDSGADVVVHDPYVNGMGGDILDVARAADTIVLVVRHDEYRQLELQSLRKLVRTPVIVDGRGVVSPTAAREAGFDYLAVGSLGRDGGHRR
jgi:UDP-N-acetyl-D-mannosaminuronic acid dehydrogenase